MAKSECNARKDIIRARGLPVCEEATSLELVELGEDGREYFLVPPAAAAWRELKASASECGISLFIVSAFRSIERQAEIVRRKLSSGVAMEEVLRIFAPPGYSEHHTGRAVDISIPGIPLLEVQFAQTPAFAWLTENASQFGFHMSYPVGNAQGYQYEPWHWCFEEARGSVREGHRQA